jgi:predicted dehydrogenase
VVGFLIRKKEDRSWWKPFEKSVADIVRNDPIKLQMEHFGCVVRGESVPLVSTLDGLNNLLVIEAIVQAAKTGKSVETAVQIN